MMCVYAGGREGNNEMTHSTIHSENLPVPIYTESVIVSIVYLSSSHMNEKKKNK